MRTETWCGYTIRFIEVHDEWYAILKDICDALDLRTDKVASRLDPDMLERVRIVSSDHLSKGDRSRGDNKTRWMLAVNEIGIYEALYSSRKLEARKFRRWSTGIMQKLRKHVGLEGYEVMRMTDSDIQEEIDHFLDDIFYDEEKGMLMRSVTVAGGDVDQVPFEW